MHTHTHATTYPVYRMVHGCRSKFTMYDSVGWYVWLRPRLDPWGTPINYTHPPPPPHTHTQTAHARSMGWLFDQGQGQIPEKHQLTVLPPPHTHKTHTLSTGWCMDVAASSRHMTVRHDWLRPRLDKLPEAHLTSHRRFSSLAFL